MDANDPSGVALNAPASLGALVDEHGGVLDDDLESRRSLVVHRIGPSDREGGFELAPILHARGVARRLSSADRVLLVAASIARDVPVGRRWVHPDAERVLAALLAAPDEPKFDVVEPGVRIGEGAFLERGVVLGPNAVIYPGVRLGRDVVIGAGCVIGRPGFGFVDRPGAPPIRMPHRAGVVLGEGVELGPLCTVDAGVLSPTVIGAHTKIDAQVHVGHGVILGSGCRVAAQVGFAGSVVVEDDVRIGGQAGIADHVHIGRGARIAAKAGVIGDVPGGAVFAGYPAVARARWLRGHARLYRR